MKLKNLFLKSMSLACIGAASLVSSCTDENRLTLQDTQDITEEAVTDSYFQDMDDMAGVAVQTPSDDQYSGGRVSTPITIEDDRFCDGIVVTVDPGVESTPNQPYGVLTVDFGTTGCTDLKGNIRTGKLIFTYNGLRFQPGSTVITTTDNYTINGIKLEGTRTLTNVTGSTTEAPKFNVTLVEGKATFVDTSVAERESNITWQWNRSGTTDLTDDFLLIDKSSTASGTTRGGRAYEVSLTKDLTFKRLCGGMPVSGTKKYLINGDKEIVIDYGSGDCDKKITVTVNGIARSLTVN
ncbi:MAG: hypothetical protein ABI663_22375 [Chryseolinea sp.]